MTRKQYEKKVRQLQRNLYRYAKENGTKVTSKADIVGRPKFGTIISVGIHKGEVLKSYQQSWDILYFILKDCDCMKGISYN